VIIEGYTDDVPISNARFASNWELSTSRAISVMNLMIEGGLDRRRVSVQGFAETRSATDVDLTSAQEREALAPEALEEARAANRRVVLRIDALNPELLREVMARGGWRQPAEATSSAPALDATPQEGGALKEGLLTPAPSAQPPQEAQPTKKTPKHAKRPKRGAQRKSKSKSKSTRKRKRKSNTRRAKSPAKKERR
jgi:chemotaxis protein MotB